MASNLNLGFDSSALALALRAAAAFAVYLVLKVTFRLYFHPLARFPGPWLAAATYKYEAYYDVVLGGQYIFKLNELHDRYGPVVRCSPGEIHVHDSSFFDTLHPGPGRTRDKWHRANRANGSPGSLASAVSHSLHRARRAVVNPYFSKAAIAQLEHTSIQSKVDLLCESLRRHTFTEDIIDLGAAMTALTLDVISEYCYGDCYDCLHDPDFAPQWKRVMTGGFESTNITKHFIWVLRLMNSLPAWLVTHLDPDMATFIQAKASLDAQARGVFAEYQKQGRAGLGHGAGSGKGKGQDRPRTIYHGIIEADLPPSEKTVNRLADEAFVLLIAGAETTARTLGVILCHLLSNPEVLGALRKELDTIMSLANGEASLPSSRALEDLPLMKAVVQEGLRLAEPVTNRQILIAPEEDLTCANIMIPRGTPVSQTFRDILLDPAIFPEPKRFDPGRWTRAAAEGTRLDRYLVSFSRGGRSCAGVNLAYAELYLTVAALVARFDMELYDFERVRDLDIVRDKFIGLPSKEARPIRLKLRPRA